MSPVITRRDFARTVGLVVATSTVASCTSAPPPAAPPSPHTSFASLYQIDAAALNDAAAERTAVAAHVVRLAQRDRPRSTRGRVRRGRPRRLPSGDLASRLALRHPQ